MSHEKQRELEQQPDDERPIDHLAGPTPSRRDIVGRVGKQLFFVTLLGIVGKPEPAYADKQKDGCLHDDKSCGKGEADASCHLTPHTASDPSKYDKDENCSATDVDNSCGDCDDNHDGDNSCGTMAEGSLDQDEDCGHIHLSGNSDPDAACTLKSGSGTESDHNCGLGDPVYNGLPGGSPSADQNCGGTLPSGQADPDSNCTGNATDDTCGQNEGAYASDPDESCAGSSSDNACGQSGTLGTNPGYDDDASCSLNNTPDEACGTQDGPGVAPTTEGDENCNAKDPDNNCPITIWDPDESD